MRFVRSVMILVLPAVFLLAGIVAYFDKEEFISCFTPGGASVIIIDAGHGGEDGGAVSISGEKESAINLAIAQKTENIAAFLGHCPVMTRESEDIEYPEGLGTIRARKRADQNRRIELINACGDAVLVSIHQNYYPGTGPNGAQVLYGGISGSEELAEMLQSALITQMDPDNRRSAERVSGDIYLMKSVNCPAVLIECGFLSNPDEERLLLQGGYQTKLAAVIAVTVVSYCSGVVYES